MVITVFDTDRTRLRTFVDGLKNIEKKNTILYEILYNVVFNLTIYSINIQSIYSSILINIK